MEKDLYELLEASKIYLEQNGDCFELLEVTSVELASDDNGKLVIYVKKKVKAE